MIYVILYLLAAAAANLTIAQFGPGLAIVVGFLFVGLDLTARDKLHDAWGGRGLYWKMPALILAGGLLSYAINRNAGPIALASLAAFGAAGLVDALAYQLLGRQRYLVRANGSNVPAALVDSLVFPTIAFGGFLPGIVAGQFLAKALGGFVWSLALGRQRSKVKQ